MRDKRKISEATKVKKVKQKCRRKKGQQISHEKQCKQKVSGVTFLKY